MATSIPVHSNQLDPAIKELCVSEWSCQASIILSELWVLFVFGLVALVIAACLFDLGDAIGVAKEEDSRIAAERDAFLEFADRVAAIPTDHSTVPQPTTDGGVLSIASGTASSKSLDAVRNAYRETVMSVEHFEEDYGESLTANMTAEFGEDVAESVTQGSQFSPMLQNALIAKSKHAATDRNRLMNSVHQEVSALQDARKTFADIEAELDDVDEEMVSGTQIPKLGDLWEKLEAIEHRCSEILQERQRNLHTEPLDHGISRETMSFHGYLYSPLDTDYPVLRKGTELVDHIERAKRKLLLEVSRRA